jgi:CRISPR-associated protein (TIGR02584 family)
VRTILVAVAGGSPAVITETLWALAREKSERVDEVRIITTSRGKEAITRVLLDGGRARFNECCRESGLDPSCVKFGEQMIEVLKDDESELADIRNSRENQLAADQVCELVRRWAAEPATRFHCSAAGGRKTLGIYLTAALMLYGRDEDRLWHVLVEPEDFERCRDFFHPYREPRTLEVRGGDGRVVSRRSTADVRIDLAEIPFVRLRELDPAQLARGAQKSYSRIVAETQERLRFLAEAVAVAVGRVRGHHKQVPLVAAGRACQLTTAGGFVYALLALRRKRREDDAGLAVAEISCADLSEVYRLLTGEEYTERLEGTDFDFVVQWRRLIGSLRATKSARRQPSDAERDKFDHDFDDLKSAIEQAVTRANAALRRAHFPERFLVVNLNRTKRRQPARYALQLEPQAILLPE